MRRPWARVAVFLVQELIGTYLPWALVALLVVSWLPVPIAGTAHAIESNPVFVVIGTVYVGAWLLARKAVMTRVELVTGFLRRRQRHLS